MHLAGKSASGLVLSAQLPCIKTAGKHLPWHEFYNPDHFLKILFVLPGEHGVYEKQCFLSYFGYIYPCCFEV